MPLNPDALTVNAPLAGHQYDKTRSSNISPDSPPVTSSVISLCVFNSKETDHPPVHKPNSQEATCPQDASTSGTLCTGCAAARLVQKHGSLLLSPNAQPDCGHRQCCKQLQPLLYRVAGGPTTCHSPGAVVCMPVLLVPGSTDAMSLSCLPSSSKPSIQFHGGLKRSPSLCAAVHCAG